MALATTTCLVEGCTFPVSCRQVCAAHYRQLKKAGQLPERAHVVKPDCSIGGCERLVLALGLCSAHYARLQRNGDPLVGPGRGSPGKVRGARGVMGKKVSHERPAVSFQSGTGDLANATREVTSMMEHHLRQPLLPGELVRHIGGNTPNNHPAYLELWVVESPPVGSLEELLKWAQALHDRYRLASRNKSV